MELDLERLPRHVAIIMDGNGRWARQKVRNRIFGHKKGAESCALDCDLLPVNWVSAI